jgi:hypothetical protein
MKLRLVLIAAIFISLISMSLFAQKGGEIIFSKSMINPSAPADLTAQFQAGDPIYAVAFFDKNIIEMARSSSAKNMIMEIFVYELKAPLYDYQEPSEMQLETASLTISGDALQKNYLPVDIIPGSDEMTAYGSADLVYKKFGPKFAGPVKFAERMSQLEPGEHTIIVKVNCNYNFVAEGKFVISGEDYSVYNQMSAELNAAASNLKTKEAVMPKSARTDKQKDISRGEGDSGAQAAAQPWW